MMVSVVLILLLFLLLSARLQHQNEKGDFDPDHWFEINLANALLFANLTLEGLPELLPGRLFSTRMPRNLAPGMDTDSANRFQAKVAANALHTVVILAETAEYDKYAGADLEAFYRSIGLEIIHRPIIDFTVPDQPDMIQNIKVSHVYSTIVYLCVLILLK